MNIVDIARRFSTVKLLGVGESSHGTHEFFDFKSKLFKELVQHHGFNTLLFEDSPSVCWAINRFIVGGEGNLDEPMKQLYSVWRVEELKQLILWLREDHDEHKVKFAGFDIDQTNENIQKRDELMAENIKKYVANNPDTKALVWAHNSHLQVTGSGFNQKPMGSFLRKYFGNEFIAIALLFGMGTVSATRLKEDTPPGRDRTLSTIPVDSIPPELAESMLHKLDTEPFFLTKNQMDEVSPDNLKAVRSIGWGLIPGMVNKIVEGTDIKTAFDGLVYFPAAQHSRPLLQ